MADVLSLLGTLAVQPAASVPAASGDALPSILLSERVNIVARINSTVTLATDSTLAVPLLVGAGGPFAVGANVVQVKVIGGKVRVRLTSADGATQAVPVDSLLQLISMSAPITAIDFTRTVGQSTILKLFMAEKL